MEVAFQAEVINWNAQDIFHHTASDKCFPEGYGISSEFEILEPLFGVLVDK